MESDLSALGPHGFAYRMQFWPNLAFTGNPLNSAPIQFEMDFLGKGRDFQEPIHLHGVIKKGIQWVCYSPSRVVFPCYLYTSLVWCSLSVMVLLFWCQQFPPPRGLIMCRIYSVLLCSDSSFLLESGSLMGVYFVNGFIQ